MVLFNEFTKIFLLSETHRRPTCLIGDLNMLHLIPTCLIWDFNMIHQRQTCQIGDLNMLHQKPTFLIGDPSKTSIYFFGDWHAWSETQQRPQHASSETDMSDWRQLLETSTCYIENRHAWSETLQKPPCPIGNKHSQSETDMPGQRPIRDHKCYIDDLSETNKLNWRPIWNRHAPINYSNICI